MLVLLSLPSKRVNVLDIFLTEASQLPVKEHLGSLRNSSQQLEL